VNQSSEFCRHNPLCYLSTSVFCCYFVIDSVRKLLDTPSYTECSFNSWTVSIFPTVLSHPTCSYTPLRSLPLKCSEASRTRQGQVQVLNESSCHSAQGTNWKNKVPDTLRGNNSAMNFALVSVAQSVGTPYYSLDNRDLILLATASGPALVPTQPPIQ